MPPALQGHTPDIVLPFDPDRARQHLKTPERPGELTIVAQDVWKPLLDEITRSWREILDLDVSVKKWTAETVDDVAPLGWPLELAPIAVLGWLPGYPDPEYCLRLILHSHAKANEGRLRVPAVRLADRFGPPCGDRRQAARAVPPGRPARGHGGGGRDPARLRPEHGVRQAGRRRLVGVREIVGVVRGSRRQLSPSAAATIPASGAFV